MPDERTMGLLATADRLLTRAADEFEKNRAVWFVLFGLFYLFSVVLRSLRPFWFDELITVNVASLPGMTDIWQILKRGGDLNPPMFFILTRAAVSVFGSSELAFRLPAILGFFVLCCCLYVFVARRA